MIESNVDEKYWRIYYFFAFELKEELQNLSSWNEIRLSNTDCIVMIQA